jgi:hypothetical protein
MGSILVFSGRHFFAIFLLLPPLIDNVPQLAKSDRLNANQTGERMI